MALLISAAAVAAFMSFVQNDSLPGLGKTASGQGALEGKDATRTRAMRMAVQRAIREQKVINALVREETQRRGITASDEDIEAAIDQVRVAYGSPAKFDRALAEQNMTIDQYRRYAADVILNSKLRREVVKPVSVSPAEARHYYETGKDQFKDDKGNVQPFKEVQEKAEESALIAKRQAAYYEFIVKLKEKSKLAN